MYVVDGYNLLHALKKRPEGLPSDFARARARVCELLSRLGGRESQTVRVFFDGTPGELGRGDTAFPRLRVTFCGPGTGAADEAIREFVSNSNEPDKLKVVSSDIEVAQACKLAGAKVISSQEMAARLGGAGGEADERPEKPTRGAIGKLEQEMLDDIGDLEEFEREVLGE